MVLFSLINGGCLVSKNLECLEQFERLKNEFQAQNWQKCIEVGEILYQNVQMLAEHDMAWTCFWLSESYRHMHRYDDAERISTFLIDLCPGSHFGFVGLIHVFVAKSEWKKVVEIAKIMQKRYPSDWGSYWWLAQAYNQLMQYEKARVWLDILLESHPNLYEPFLERMKIAMRQYDWNGVIDLAMVGTQRFPNKAEIYYWTAQAYKNLSNYQQAVLEFEKFLSHQDFEDLEKIAQAIAYKTECFYKLNEYCKIENHYLDKIHQKIKIIDNYLFLMEWYIKNKCFDKLYCLIGRMRGDLGESFDGSYYLGRYYQLIDNHEESRRVFFGLLKTYPNNPFVLEECINLVKHQDNLKELINLINIAKVRFGGDWIGFCYNSKQCFKSTQHGYSFLYRQVIDDKVRQLNPSVYQQNLWFCDAIRSVICAHHPLRYWVMFCSFLMKTNQLVEANHVLKCMKRNYSHKDINKLHAHLLARENRFDEALIVMKGLLRDNPEEKKEIHNIFFTISLLQKLRNYSKVSDNFRTIYLNPKVKNSYPLQVFKMHSDSLSFPTIRKKTYANIVKRKVLPIAVPDNIFYKYYDNGTDNEVLFVCFSGIDGNPNNSKNAFYNSNNIDKIIECFIDDIQKGVILDGGRDLGKFAYQSFSQSSKDMNFLVFRDAFQSYHLLNLEQVVGTIKRVVDNSNIKYVICMGFSGGGHASIVIGNLIGADLIFSFSPRLPFIMGNKPYQYQLQFQRNITDPNLINISHLQHKNNGFKVKTYITLCKDEPCDNISIHFLDKSDKNLNLTYFYGDTHYVLDEIGKSNVFQEILRIVDLEKKNDFRLPIQKTFLAHLPNFAFNNLE